MAEMRVRAAMAPEAQKTVVLILSVVTMDLPPCSMTDFGHFLRGARSGSRINGGENTNDPCPPLAPVCRDAAHCFGGLPRVRSIQAPRRSGPPVAGPPSVSEEVRLGRQGPEGCRGFCQQGRHSERSACLRGL